MWKKKNYDARTFFSDEFSMSQMHCIREHQHTNFHTPTQSDYIKIATGWVRIILSFFIVEVNKQIFAFLYRRAPFARLLLRFVPFLYVFFCWCLLVIQDWSEMKFLWLLFWCTVVCQSYFYFRFFSLFFDASALFGSLWHQLNLIFPKS